jgi:hypothetical protein
LLVGVALVVPHKFADVLEIEQDLGVVLVAQLLSGCPLQVELLR